jgi:hypothetical protein
MSITNLGAPSNPATGQISDVYTYFPPITSARAGQTPARTARELKITTRLITITVDAAPSVVSPPRPSLKGAKSERITPQTSQRPPLAMLYFTDRFVRCIRLIVGCFLRLPRYEKVPFATYS